MDLNNTAGENLLTNEIPENNLCFYYNSYRERLLTFASKYLPDTSVAEDIVQELFIDLYRKEIQLSQITSLNAYLHRAITNRIRNFLRNNHLYEAHIARNSSLGAPGYDPIQSSENTKDLMNQLKYCLAEMPDKYSTVFILKRIYHLSINEIADKLQRPKDTVDKQLRKATTILRKKINHFSQHLTIPSTGQPK